MTITDSDGTIVEPGDLINFDSLLTEEELALRARVRAFVDDQIRPNIADWYERAHFPLEIVPEMAKLGLLGMHLSGLRLRGPFRGRLRTGRRRAGGRRLGPADLRLRPGFAGDVRDLQVRLRGAEDTVAAADGRAARRSAASG